jgi:CBS domain-containing membrane protein
MIRHSSALLPGGTGNPLSEINLVSPFAATAFLNLTVPNSPLAQPWSVVVGNTLGTAAGVLCFALLPFPILAAALSVALAVLAMAWLRALHPPGAAMALNAVIFGALFNPLTGRRYPFRQPDEALPKEAACLADILERFRVSATIGVADLSRLIIVAETEATAHHLGHKMAASMMTHDPFALPPEADLEAIRAAFRDHPFRAIPVAKADATSCGLILQNAMLDAEGDATAAKVMDKVPTLAPEAELPAIMPLLTQGNCRVVPVVDQDRLVGVITWSDLIRLLSRSLREGQN